MKKITFKSIALASFASLFSLAIISCGPGKTPEQIAAEKTAKVEKEKATIKKFITELSMTEEQKVKLHPLNRSKSIEVSYKADSMFISYKNMFNAIESVKLDLNNVDKIWVSSGSQSFRKEMIEVGDVSIKMKKGKFATVYNTEKKETEEDDLISLNVKNNSALLDSVEFAGRRLIKVLRK